MREGKETGSVPPPMRVRRLVLRLASPHPDEVLEAAHALVQRLHALGRGLYDVCDTIERGPSGDDWLPAKRQSGDLHGLAMSIR
jgi:hypothetical protein